MTFDPYAVLGLARQATPDDIARAFRRRSKETHPDLHPESGDAAARFGHVRRAYDVLRDPAKRDRYDRTGELPEEGAATGTGDEAAWGLVSGMLASLLAADADPFTQDIAQVMRAALGDQVAKLEESAKKLKRAGERAGRMAGRFKRKAAKSRAGPDQAGGREGESMLERVLAHHKQDVAAKIKAVEQAIALRLRARDLLEGFSFAPDAPMPNVTFGSLYAGAARTANFRVG